jgi:uncharacterized OB-fold protein
VTIPGIGHIYSYEVVEQAIQPEMAALIPYVVVLVELELQRGVPTPDEAMRLIGNLLDRNFKPERATNVAINAAVEVVFQPADGGFAVPQWTLTGAPPVTAHWQLPE